MLPPEVETCLLLLSTFLLFGKQTKVQSTVGVALGLLLFITSGERLCSSEATLVSTSGVSSFVSPYLP
jgi:hypothetical protein